MILLNRETRKSTSMVGANGHLNELGRVRLTRELFCGRYRPGQRVRLREIAAKYGLDNHAVLKLLLNFNLLDWLHCRAILQQSFTPQTSKRCTRHMRYAPGLKKSLEERRRRC